MNTGDWPRLADYLRDEMDQRGWTQHDLAHHAGVGTQMVYRLLNGRGFQRRPYKMPRIERALGWEPGTARHILEGGEPEPKTEPEPAAAADDDAWIDDLLAKLDDMPDRAKLEALARINMEILRQRAHGEPAPDDNDA